ncbi:hypothetical protein RQP46_009640 [Phenoliferia psychrophenolica]
MQPRGTKIRWVQVGTEELMPRATRRIKFTDDLMKREVFKLPDPFAAVHVYASSEPYAAPVLSLATPIVRNTLNPYWSASFEFEADDNTKILVRVHDNSKYKKRDQGFLGEVTIHCGDVLPSSRTGMVNLQRDLSKSSENIAVQGKLIIPGALSPGVGPANNYGQQQQQFGSQNDDALDAVDMESQAPPVPALPAGLGVPRLSASGSSRSNSPGGSRVRPGSSGRSSSGGSTSTVRPAVATVVENEAPLPTGWEMRKAPDGRVYFVDHANRTTTWVDPRPKPAVAPASDVIAVAPVVLEVAKLSVTEEQLGPLPSGWEVRSTPGGKKYWVDHNTKTTTWDDPRMPSIGDGGDQSKRDFRRKLVYFRSQPAQRVATGECRLNVRREHLFEDAYAEIMRYSPSDLRKRLMISFSGEEGLDYGGVSREFFFLLSHAIFDPSFALFENTNKGNYTLQISPNSGVNPEHLSYFRFIGRAVGLAIFHRRFLDAHFAPSIYKLALGKPVGVPEMALIDADLHQSLTWMAENDITDAGLENDFVDEYDNFGMTEIVPLKPGGADIKVTEANKMEYIHLLCKHRLEGRIEEQVKAFRHGLHEVVSAEALAIFDERELELLIGGLSDVDVDDWKKNTDYRGYAATDQVVMWFWETLQSWPMEKRSRLLQFTTGTSRTPVNGFRDLQGSDGPRKFTIEMAGAADALPKTHTCFNRLDLPPYATRENLEYKLVYAMEETAGFSQE